jgi:hypothetical protein
MQQSPVAQAPASDVLQVVPVTQLPTSQTSPLEQPLLQAPQWST